jgi:hypothetical protein
LTLLALFSAPVPGWAQDRVLVPGTPPLTQKAVDRDIEVREYLLRLKLSPSGRRDYQQALVNDWKAWDATTREKVLSWHKWWAGVQKMSAFDRPGARAKEVVGYLEGLSRSEAESERWLLSLYRAVYQKAADRHPTGVMEKQPEPAADAVAILGADPNLRRVLEKPTVFTRPQLYGYFSYIPSQDALGRATLFTTDNRLWLLPTGRACLTISTYNGLTNPRGKDTVTQDWGRYTIESEFRLRIEFDNGDRATLPLVEGRSTVYSGGRAYQTPDRDKK